MYSDLNCFSYVSTFSYSSFFIIASLKIFSFSLACFIVWQTHLKRYDKSISFEIIAIASFIFSISNSSNSSFVVSSSISYIALFVLSISSSSVTCFCLSITVSKFLFLLGLPFLYVGRKQDKEHFSINFLSCDFRFVQTCSKNTATE